MTIKNICFLNAFLFYGLEVNNHAVRYLVRTIFVVLDVLQCFAHPLLSVDFYGRVKIDRNAVSEFRQKKHAEAAE